MWGLGVSCHCFSFIFLVVFPISHPMMIQSQSIESVSPFTGFPSKVNRFQRSYQWLGMLE